MIRPNPSADCRLPREEIRQRTRKSAWARGLLVGCWGALAWSPLAQGRSLDRSRIPATKLTIGSNLDQIVSATEACTIQSNAPCRVEEYSSELSDQVRITVPSFSMMRFEVSQGEYSRCVALGHCDPFSITLIPLLLRSPELPMVMVNLADARDYCSSQGGRLPTEEEFEAAAAGHQGRAYPWGSHFHSKLANFGARRSPYEDSSDGFALLAPVKALMQGNSPQGLAQLAGNAAEWTISPFVPHGEKATMVGANQNRVVKGGSFLQIPIDLRGQARREMAPSQRSVDVGFRCVFPT